MTRSRYGRLVFAALLLLGLLPAAAPRHGWAAAPATGFDSNTFTPFYFIDETDCHLASTDPRLQSGIQNFWNLGLTATRIQAPFVLLGGDIGDTAGDPANWSDFDDLADAFQVPLKPIPGNHDVNSMETLQAYREHFQAYGNDYYSFTYNNCAFICIDSVVLQDAAAYPAEYPVQWAWLEGALDAAWTAQRDYIFILLHHPPYVFQEDETNVTWDTWPLPERTHLLDLARTYGVSAILAGHQHRNIALPRNSPPLYITPGTAYNFIDGTDLAYRVIKVTRQKFEPIYVSVSKGQDTQAPAAPRALAVGGRTPSAVTLEWAPATDNVGVLRYGVWRDGLLLGYAVEERYTDSGLKAGQGHVYQVTAEDVAGNSSAPSTPLPAGPGPANILALTPAGAAWRYLDGGADPGGDWYLADFDDSRWKTGLAQLGYGEGDEATTVSYGGNPAAKAITTYFRHPFVVDNPAAFTAPTLRLCCDDGAIVYLNGEEVAHWNMPAGSVSAATPAAGEITGAGKGAWHELLLTRFPVNAGLNVLAVEVHQSGPASPGLSFDLDLAASLALSTTALARGPYQQSASPTALTLRWRTAAPAISRVTYGTPAQYPALTMTDLNLATEHELRLTGLTPGTRYLYRIEAAGPALTGDDGSCAFLTPPAAGAEASTRIWVLGDSGMGNANAGAVRDAFARFSGARNPNLWLMLGDNAYTSGTDTQYQQAVFKMYPLALRGAALWPALGNHDTYSTLAGTAVHPYYNIFTLPALGECGGAASGGEAYYSFDYGNAHFICLDSSESDRSTGGAMLSWLKRDLAASQGARWTIAFFHHAPYSKGSHDSDAAAEVNMTQMRQNVLPILEAGGVDLVLAGHSHDYERSFLINGHYGLSSTLKPSMILNHGDGWSLGGGPYVKPPTRTPGAGTVYAVVGCSGKTEWGLLNHPVMVKSLALLGSLVLDLDGRMLNAHFIDNTGLVRDEFTIWKGKPDNAAGPGWRGYR